MNISIFISLLFALQFFYWFIGKRASKGLIGKEDYFLAGKSVQLFPLTMTFLATNIGGGVILGAAEEAYLFGWPVLLYPVGGALGFIILGTGIGRRLADFQVETVAQIFEVVYRSTLLRKIASVLSVVALFLILVTQIIGSHKFLMSMGIDNTPLFILFWAIVIIYTAQGGLKAVISTDAIQAIFFSVIFMFCFGFVLYTEPAIQSMRMPELQNFTDVSPKLFGWLFLPMLWMIIGQDIAQRCFAGGSSRIVTKAALLAALGSVIICIVPVFFGSLALTMGLDIPKGNSVFMTVISTTTTPLLGAFVGCAVIAAVISTATSLINAIGSNLASDFQDTKRQEARPLWVMQTITCAISIAAVISAFYFDNIVELLILTYELFIGCLFAPIFIALFKKRGNFLAALLAMLFGAISFVVFRVYPIEFPREAASILLSFCGYGLGEIIAVTGENRRLYRI